MEYDELAKLIDQEALNAFRRRSLSPDHPVVRGTAQNPDIYFQEREVSNSYYEAIPGIVEEYMGEINKLTGRDYHLFNYYGAEDADRIIIAMGSVCDVVEETVDYLNAKGEKVGLLTIHLYRPFSLEHFFRYIPKTVKKIAVLDRTKEPGSIGEPLYLDVKSAFYGKEWQPVIVGGRYGLGSKDVIPSHILPVFENLKLPVPKDRFTVSIVDDVTFTSLPAVLISTQHPQEQPHASSGVLVPTALWARTKPPSKSSATIPTCMHRLILPTIPKKSGGITVSHLRFGKKPIKSSYLINKADFVACHNQSYVNKYDVLAGLKPKGVFLLNCTWSLEELDEKLPGFYETLYCTK